MRDPVSEELARRAAEPLSWRWALAVAAALHLLAFGALLLSPKPSRKALTLPSVRVHMAQLPLAAAPSGAPQQAPAPAPPAPKPRPETKTSPAQNSAPARKAAFREKTPAKTPPPAAASAGAAAPGEGIGPRGGTAAGLGLASGASEGPPFPYQYYLERVLAAIEENWFKPEAPPGTRCRVRCRIARSGQLLEAGLEEPSAHGAFDRAALRAVYAAAPFPPLPQGFGGSELVLHLEFVQ